MFEFSLKTDGGNRPVNCYRQVNNFNNGKYLFRFRLFESVKDLQLKIKDRQTQQHIQQSPFIIRGSFITHVYLYIYIGWVLGWLYSDGCYCPETNVSKWFESMECQSAVPQQLRQQLKQFPTIDMKSILQRADQLYFKHRQSYSLCHYVVKKNKVFIHEFLSIYFFIVFFSV